FIQKNGIKALILDIDNTLAEDFSPELRCDIAAWLSDIKKAGIKAVIVSNNDNVRAAPFAEKCGLEYISDAGKPSAKSSVRAFALLDSSKTDTAVIGDQLFTDIAYGKRIGCRTILTEKFSPDILFFVRLKRLFERPFMRRIRKRGVTKI
ncbi:MAG: YqeG family HAD IIIA-type phosphatase, partial [Oscillospiraceae bacterium]